MNNARFPIIRSDTCSSNPFKSIRYTYNGKTSHILKNYFKYLKNDNEHEDDKNKIIVSFSDFNDIKYLNVLDENTSFEFDGGWYNDFINRMNSKDSLLNALKAMPQNLRLNGRDKCGSLIIHCLFYKKTEWCEREIMDLTLNENNSLAKDWGNYTLLHWACVKNNLELVKHVIKCGGFNIDISDHRRFPTDMTKNQEIIQFLSDFENGASISFD